MQLFKNLIKKSIRLYLAPFIKSERLYYYTKDVIFTNCSEHLHRAIHYLASKEAGYPLFCVVDIGAAEGGTTAFFANAFSGKKVYGYEPNVNEYKKATENYRHLKSVEFVNKALGDKEEKSILYVTQNKLSSSLNKIDDSEFTLLSTDRQSLFQQVDAQKVIVTTLDTELKDKTGVFLMKIDTQGTELAILQGGIQTLKKTKFILLEMNNHHIYENTCQYYEVDSFLRENEFKLVQIYSPWGDANEYDALYENQKL
jgi:FkbM family methyltransferase